MGFCEEKTHRTIRCQRQPAQALFDIVAMLFNGNDVTVGEPGQFRPGSKTLACRALNGGQTGNIMRSGGAEGDFHGGKYSLICLFRADQQRRVEIADHHRLFRRAFDGQ